MQSFSNGRLVQAIVLLFLFIANNLFNPTSAQLPPGITPYMGIPVLVPETLCELNMPNGYCQLSYGNSGIIRSISTCEPLNPGTQTSGSVANSHTIIASPSNDSLACLGGIPGVFLSTFPNIQDWDTLNYGVPRVMRLNDSNPGSQPYANAVATYYFTPTEEQNLLIFWAAFVS